MIEMRNAVMGMTLMFLVSACGGESSLPGDLGLDEQQGVSGMAPEGQATITQAAIGFYYLEDCNPPLGIGNECT